MLGMSKECIFGLIVICYDSCEIGFSFNYSTHEMGTHD